MGQDSVNRSGDVIVNIIIISVIMGALLLALAIVITSLSNANVGFNGQNATVFTVINETGAFANQSGYTIGASDLNGFRSPTLTQVFNRSNATGGAIALANFTLSSLGVLTNATNITWNNLSISYTAIYDAYVNGTVNTGLLSIQTGVFGLVTNFFSLAPTIGTIFAVIILIAGIVLLVLYVKRMKDSGERGSNVQFQG